MLSIFRFGGIPGKTHGKPVVMSSSAGNRGLYIGGPGTALRITPLKSTAASQRRHFAR